MRRRHYSGRHRAAPGPGRTARAGIIAGLAALLAGTTLQVPAAPATAALSSTKLDLTQFRLADGLSRYAEDVQELVDAMRERQVAFDRAKLAVYEVPTVEGLVRYITDKPQSFIVRPNPELVSHDPELGEVVIDRPSVALRLNPEGALNGETPNVTTFDPASIYEVIPLAVAAPPGPEDIMVNPNVDLLGPDEGEPGWTNRVKDCVFMGSDYFERWVCWRIDGQSYDNDSNHNYWQLHTDITGHSKGRKMERMWVEAVPQPRGSHPQRFDATPVPNAAYGGNEGCSTSGQTFQIASGSPVQFAVGWYWERQTCETYQPKTYGSEHGHWASIWNGNPMAYPNAQRYVLLKMPVKTPWDKGVAWELWTGQATRW